MTEFDEKVYNVALQLFEYINNLTNLRRRLTFDEWSLVYSEDLWYMWCMLKEYTTYNTIPVFGNMDYGSFCHIAYEKSPR